MTKRENTGKKHALTPEMEERKWEPGKSGNPNGRPKGSRNKFSERFISDFLAEWEEGGAEALKAVRVSDPSTFLRVAASIIPKEFNINEGETALERLLEQYGDTELNQLIAGLCEIGATTEGAEGEAKKAPAKRSRQIH